MNVFIENEAGKALKNLFNEKTLEFRKSVTVSANYPYPYGFLLDTTSGDGDNLDCFILTRKPLKTGDIVEAEPIAMMEQIEDGQTDHKIIAQLKTDPITLTPAIQDSLVTFTKQVFSHIPGKHMQVGRFLPATDALRLIENCRDAPKA